MSAPERLDTAAQIDGGSTPAASVLVEHLDLWTGAISKKSTAGRGRNSKIALTGITKLRELILDLAVRGKLVPQDPNDEPASELLKRIEAEKARLVQDGVLKKPKKPSEMEDVESTSSLPSSWQWARLGDLVSIMDAGWSPACPPEPSSDDSIWGVLKTTAVQVMEYKQEENKRLPDNKEPRPQYEVRTGDILITRAGPKNRVGVSCLVESTRQKLMISDKIIRFHLVEAGMSERFVSLCLNSGSTAEFLEGAKSGMAESQMNISQDKLKNAPIPLAPVAEQHSIVAKVDELMTLCDHLEQQTSEQISAHETLVDVLLESLLTPADSTLPPAQAAAELADNWARLAAHFDTLFTTEHSIERLKQTILQLAVMGRLVPQDPNDEPASELLKRIEAEKAQLVKEGKIKKKAVLLPIRENEKTFVLPKGWEWCRFGEIGEIYGGGTPSKSNHSYWNGNIPWVSPKDMKVDYISEAQMAVSEQAIEETSIQLIPAGSLLVVVRGMILAHSFPSAINKVPVVINQDMKAVLTQGFYSDYLLQLVKGMKSDFVSMVDRSSHGTCKLVSEKLWNKPLAIPPLNEQHRIVAKVDELMALCDQLKARLTQANTTRCHLAEAVVEQAVAS